MFAYFEFEQKLESFSFGHERIRENKKVSNELVDNCTCSKNKTSLVVETQFVLYFRTNTLILGKV